MTKKLFETTLLIACLICFNLNIANASETSDLAENGDNILLASAAQEIAMAASGIPLPAARHEKLTPKRAPLPVKSEQITEAKTIKSKVTTPLPASNNTEALESKNSDKLNPIQFVAQIFQTAPVVSVPLPSAVPLPTIAVTQVVKQSAQNQKTVAVSTTPAVTVASIAKQTTPTVTVKKVDVTASSPSDNIKRTIVDTALKLGVDPYIALSIAKIETGFNHGKRSHAGAVGVYQLMPGTARILGVNPYSVNENIKGALMYYKQLYKKYGSVELALAAYNAGPGNVAKYGGVPPFGQTKAYIQQVKRQTAVYKANPNLNPELETMIFKGKFSL